MSFLRGTEPVSALTRVLFILLLFNNFFFLGFRQWQSRTDRVLTLNMNIEMVKKMFPLVRRKFWILS